MNTTQSDTVKAPAALELGAIIRQARQQQKLTLAELAERIGRPREWLNRVELGYSQYGEFKPPSSADVQALIACLGSTLPHSKGLLALQKQAETDFQALRRTRKRRITAGKLTHTELIMGESNVTQAIIDLINEQHSDAIIRNTGIKGLGSYLKLTEDWRRYREALGAFLTKHPNSLFKRVEYTADSNHLELAKAADARIAGSRELKDVHNAKVKFHKDNPLLLHVLIGQREAILALPQATGQSGSSMALLVRDKLFVEALRVWYDEVLWEGAGPSRTVKFDHFDESFDEIKSMYGFK